MLDYQVLFDCAPTPYLVLAPDLPIVAVNQAYLAATGTERADILHRPIFEVFPDNPADPAANGVRNLRQSLETVLATAAPDTMALQRYDIPTRPDGRFEERYWSPINTPVLGPGRTITHIIHRVQDVTDFVRMRAARDRQRAVADEIESDLFVRAREVQDINQRLRAANEELAATSRALRQAQEAKDRFIATLSHELRNPLAAVQAAVDLLELDVSPDHAALAVLRRQTTALIRMTDDLLDATRALTGRLELVRGPLDLRTVVDAAVADIAADYARSKRALRVTLPDEAMPMDGDHVRLAQMVGNLLSNAGKYTEPGATVAVFLARSGGEVLLSVRDDGIGFEPSVAETLFEVFARAVHPDTHRVGGLGLGLAVVRSITELHGGVVTAHSAGPGLGAEFRVRLPLTLDQRPVDTPAAAQVVARAPMRVLVIEDNADLAATYQALLRRRGDSVTVAGTGREGLTAAASEEFQLVLCDIGLPDINGYQVARCLRSHPATRGLKLVAVSGFSQDRDRERARVAGFDAHLAKPLASADLDEVLGQWVNARPSAPRDPA